MNTELQEQIKQDQQDRCNVAANHIKAICEEYQVDFQVIAVSPVTKFPVLVREILPDWSIMSNLVPKELKK